MVDTEFIRLEVRGEPPQILRRLQWSGAEPLRSEFFEYAKPALQGVYETGTFQPKTGFGELWGGQPAPEGIRLIGDDGAERWRYTL